MYDILIVGGGTAGLTAAIYAARAGKSALVLESTAFGGQIADSPLVENYPGVPSVSGVDYAEALAGQARALGAELRLGRVTEAARTEQGFAVTAGRKQYEGRALILATGARHRRLGLDGEEALEGRGVSYCAVCDGAFFKDRDVAVVGGGDSALQAALFLSNVAKSVTLIHRRDTFRGQWAYVEALRERGNVAFALNARVTALHGEEKLTAVTLTTPEGSRELAVEGLFVSVGQQPDNGPFAHLAALDGEGYFRAGEGCETATPGVFAAGDCRSKGLRQLTTAAADGSVAAIAACRWLEGR